MLRGIFSGRLDNWKGEVLKVVNEVSLLVDERRNIKLDDKDFKVSIQVCELLVMDGAANGDNFL